MSATDLCVHDDYRYSCPVCNAADAGDTALADARVVREMEAIYEGSCPLCREKIHVGDMICGIKYDDDPDQTVEWVHPACARRLMARLEG